MHVASIRDVKFLPVIFDVNFPDRLILWNALHSFSHLRKHYTQINGATIGGPESASTTDIFRAVFIDQPALKEGPFGQLEFCGYRDDMFDVEITKTKEEINAFTDF